MHVMRVGVRSVVALAFVAVVGCNDETKVALHDGGVMEAGAIDSAIDSALDDNDGGDCRPPMVATECDANRDGWFAIKATLDVWWQGTEIHDPGRDDIEVYALARLDAACGGASNQGELKLCGLRLPTITSDLGCDAVDLQVPDVMWESDSAWHTAITGTVASFEPGSVETFHPLTALHGIDLVGGSEAMWPPSSRAADVFCEAGSGEACFPDHDGDGLPGVTLRPRTDGASNLPRSERTTYVGPYGDGKCGSGVEYKYQAMPASSCRCEAGDGRPVLAQEIYLGVGIGFGGPVTFGAACASGTGSINAPLFELRAVGCKVDAQSPYPFDPRLETGDVTCTADEVRYLQDEMPRFQTLRAGEMPGDSRRLLGWQFIERDIDKRVSEGAKVSMVRIANVDDNEPTCAVVRAAAFPPHSTE